MYLLDTCILIHLLERNPGVAARLPLLSTDVTLHASVISEGELLAGVQRLPADERTQETGMIRTLLKRITILAVTSSVAERYGRVRDQLRAGARNDAWIAATALEHDLILVTDDKDFSRVPGLTVENWVR
jgi:tRNA(fMet)-specific endonuclease VapC